MPIPEGGEPINAYMTTAEQCIKGFLYKVSAAKLTLITAKADEVVAVGAEDSVEADGTARNADICKVWNEGIRPVKTKAGTYQPFGLVYASDDDDGTATATDPTTGTIIGRAIVPIATTYLVNELVPVCLDLKGKNSLS